MNKKNLNKILIPLVVLIWAIVAGRYFINWGNNDLEEEGKAQAIELSQISVSDSFSLRKTYRDPFLDTYPKGKTISNSQSKNQSSKINLTLKPEKREFTMPSVNYMGRVQGPDSVRMTGLISINGQPRQVQNGEQILGLSVLEIGQNSVRIQWEDSVIVIKN